MEGFCDGISSVRNNFSISICDEWSEGVISFKCATESHFSTEINQQRSVASLRIIEEKAPKKLVFCDISTVQIATKIYLMRFIRNLLHVDLVHFKGTEIGACE